MTTYILAIDQGTTSSRTLIFDKDMQIVAAAQEEFPQHFPQSGWVEHDAEDIWNSVVSTMNSALDKANSQASDIAAIGITNQRETTVVWDKNTGKPVNNAIVWQDRRTSEICDDLKKNYGEELVNDITGLVIDPYFSATKIKWILDNIAGARERAEAGDLLFGTIDSFLIWRLTNGASHNTDATNAARTMLFDIRQNVWSEDMCKQLDIPTSMLPDVKDCADEFGVCTILDHPIPILGVAGDQQAALIGQACFEPGMVKSTYGTGCFAIVNTGSEAVRSQHRLLTTIAYRLDGEVTYALEGSIFIAGAVVQWLRDGVKFIEKASDAQKLAMDADPAQNVVIVPAFTGLGAPYWKPNARGAVFGLTRNSSEKEFAQAALQSVGFQTHDLVKALDADLGFGGRAVLRVDGGMSSSDYTMQFLADILDIQVDRPLVLETTIMGAAWLAGHRIGLYGSPQEFAKTWAADKVFLPKMDKDEREEKIISWKRAVEATIGFS